MKYKEHNLTFEELIKKEKEAWAEAAVEKHINFMKSSMSPKEFKNWKESTKPKECYKILQNFKGTLKRDIDIKKEKLEALDEKYNINQKNQKKE